MTDANPATVSERLRSNAAHLQPTWCEIADELDKLRARVKALEGALRNIQSAVRIGATDTLWMGQGYGEPTVVDFIDETLEGAALKEPPMAEWQPIETAPKDGTRIDLFGTSGRHQLRVPDCYWHRKAQRWLTKHHDKDGYSALRLPFAPTHWQPLPAPPA
jgi:hypothetical protein